MFESGKMQCKRKEPKGKEMKRTNLNLTNNFLAALVILSGVFYEWVGVLAAVVLLNIVSDEWLKKMMVRFVAVIFVFNVIFLGIHGADQLISTLRRMTTIPLKIAGIITTFEMVVVLLRYIYLGMMAWKAYKRNVFTITVIERIVATVYRPTESETMGKSAVCKVCGATLGENDMFCQKCGAHVEAADKVR